MSKYDEIDYAPESYIDERLRWTKVLIKHIEAEKKWYPVRSLEGIWFDYEKWKKWQMTPIKNMPLLNMADIKPFKIDGTKGRFHFILPNQ
jgi:hypothetical protein